MSLFKLSSKSATGNIKENAFSRWFKAGANTDMNLASVRLNEDLFSPNVIPTFQIDYSDSVFAIGSCFARGIEGALSRRGLNVESMADEFKDFELVNDKVTGLGFTNKYSTFSILNEVKWALEPNEEFPAGSIVDLSDVQSIDPNTNSTLKYVNRAGTVHRREVISNVMSRIKNCRVIFLTLGLVEVWYDEVEEVYLNMAPTPAMSAKNPDRYTFHVTSYEENLNNLEELHRLLSKYGHPDFKVVVTVSPVPLLATFTSRDVVVANTYSKSLLRAVAETWSTTHENVDYFPSYEIVVNSKNSVVWSEDLRHVQGKAVQHIMKIFVENYLSSSKKEITHQLAGASNSIKNILSKLKNG